MARNKALIIFDWDDTLFPTSWLLGNNIKLDNLSDKRKYSVYFRELDISLSQLLKTVLKISKVLIITNASIDWIHLSKKILPVTSEIIDSHIRVISARDIYHQVYDMTEWKKRTFRNNICDYVNWSEQIISVGDAEYEYNALVSLQQSVSPNMPLKTVRLVRTPSFDVLIDQITVMKDSINEICEKPSHLDLQILTMM
jgi:hypothetical protein